MIYSAFRELEKSFWGRVSYHNYKEEMERIPYSN